MSRSSERDPSFTEGEARKILGRAAEIQGEAGQEEPLPLGLTLREIQKAAESAGIDPDHVVEAARSLRFVTAPPTGGGLLGPAARYDVALTVEGEVPAAEFPRLRELIREAMQEDPGQDTPRPAATGTAAERFEWSHGTLEQIRVTPAGGKTEIRAQGRWQIVSRALYGGLAAGGAVAGLIVSTLASGGGLLRLLLVGGGLVAGLLAARTLWPRQLGRARQRLDSAVRAVARHAAATARKQVEAAPGKQAP